MAKSIGLVGTLSGKAGNFVFCKGVDGRTIVRPYQPQVYNPKTAGQSAQRAKMALAGLISSITPSSLLVGMGAGRKVANRAAFVQNILRKAESVLVDGQYRAGIVGDDIIFARGVAPLRCSMGRPTLTESKVTVQVTPNITEELYGKVGVRLVAVVVEKEGLEINFKEVAFSDVVLTGNTAITQDINLASALVSRESYVGTYAIPFEITAEAASEYLGENGVITANVTTLVASLRSNSSLIKDWGDSRMLEDFQLWTT